MLLPWDNFALYILYTLSEQYIFKSTCQPHCNTVLGVHKTTIASFPKAHYVEIRFNSTILHQKQTLDVV